MFGIPDYHPHMYTCTSVLLNDHRQALEGLAGKKIKAIWTAWEQAEWFNDCPVVICFEDVQLELCAYQTDQLFVTFNQIDLSKEIDWYGSELRVSWQKNKLASLHYVPGRKLEKIEIIEYNFFISGMGFYLDDGYFAICNGLDENRVVTKKEKNPYEKTFMISV